MAIRRDATTLGIALITAGGALAAAFGAVQATNEHSVWASPWFDIGMAAMLIGFGLVLWRFVRPARESPPAIPAPQRPPTVGLEAHDEAQIIAKRVSGYDQGARAYGKGKIHGEDFEGPP